jgi:hypothetical protein
VTFWLIGVRPNAKERGKRRTWVRRILITLLIALGALTIPLGLGLLEIVATGRNRVHVSEGLKTDVEARVTLDPQMTLLSVRRSHTHEQVEILLAGPKEPPQALIAELVQIVAGRHGHPVPVRVITLRQTWVHTSAAAVETGSGPSLLPGR